MLGDETKAQRDEVRVSRERMEELGSAPGSFYMTTRELWFKSPLWLPGYYNVFPFWALENKIFEQVKSITQNITRSQCEGFFLNQKFDCLMTFSLKKMSLPDEKKKSHLGWQS